MKNEQYNKDVLTGSQIITRQKYNYAGQIFTGITGRSSYDGVEPGVTVTEGFSRSDYDYFRPESAIPNNVNSIIDACMQAYNRFSIVRNILDMMADFTVKGIDVENRNDKAQKFGKEWMSKVMAPQKAERISLMLFLTANVPIQRLIGNIPGFNPKSSVKTVYKSPVPKGQIPVGYYIMDPRSIEAPPTIFYDGDFGNSASGYYELRLNEKRYKSKREGGLRFSGDFLEKEPTYRKIKMTPDKHVMLFYKKHDFESMAVPLIYPIIRDLQIMEKLRLSDLAALDGAVSRLRIFKLGDIANGVFPTEAMFQRLNELLSQSVNGGTQDVIWGPDLKVETQESNLHLFLGKTKYAPTIESIFHGFGIPPTLAGSEGKIGYSNNFTSLRTLSERLAYVRSIIKKFFEYELDIVRQTMGFRHPFEIVFDEPVIGDEAQEKKLLIELLDRNIISEETVRDRFGTDPEIEKYRIKREARQREKMGLPKLGQYTLDESQIKDNSDNRGRPYGSKDNVKRVRKKGILMKSGSYKDLIKSRKKIRQSYLAEINKADIRSMTVAENEEFERRYFNDFAGGDIEAIKRYGKMIKENPGMSIDERHLCMLMSINGVENIEGEI